MDGRLVIMEGSLLLIFLLFQWMVALSILKVVPCSDFVTPMDGSLDIMECSFFFEILLLQWMVAFSL